MRQMLPLRIQKLKGSVPGTHARHARGSSPPKHDTLASPLGGDASGQFIFRWDQSLKLYSETKSFGLSPN